MLHPDAPNPADVARPVTAPPLAREHLDRDGVSRAASGRAAAFDADPDARVLAVHAGRVLVVEPSSDADAPGLELRHPSTLPASDVRCYLGRTLDAGTDAAGRALPAGSPIEAWTYGADAAAAIADDTRWVGLRGVATALDDRDAGLAIEAVALANWHATHAFCPGCGSPTEVVQSGWARRCLAEDRLRFPRTDPAVIVLVTDDEDRVLLGSNAMWEQDRFSVLAGFVEPGESLEAAVVREIGEEAGLAVDRVEYLGSQPWPFPASLMCAFRARVARGAATTVVPDGEEILELRWFDRDALRDALGRVALPGETSIARWMLEEWYGGPLASSMPWSTS
ncbi:NAD(+) diphosphatase [Agromyces sp. SYSU T00266]|uniref:NAD(+) diphosphatase n=1 Tax=Agromyces zhanjiangensis TaxID=3158562 RepID=UPI0033929EE2